MIFGNWKITEEAITWSSNRFQRFEIPLKQLNNIRLHDDNKTVIYDWILLATAEDWITENDLWDLNYAFVFAAAKYGLQFSYETFDATLEIQFEQFESEDNEDADI